VLDGEVSRAWCAFVEGLVGSQSVVGVAEQFDFDGEGVAVADGGAVEMFVLQRAEEPLDYAVAPHRQLHLIRGDRSDHRRARQEYGWGADLTWRVRTGVRILLGFLDGPGAVITASDAVVLAGTGLPMNRSLEILVAAGMAGEDRIPAIEAWFTKQTTRLPEPMVTELRRWFDVMLHGSRTPPRRRPRTQITTRLHLAWALLALSAARINIGFHQPQQPLPLDIRFVREALTSPGPGGDRGPGRLPRPAPRAGPRTAGHRRTRRPAPRRWPGDPAGRARPHPAWRPGWITGLGTGRAPPTRTCSSPCAPRWAPARSVTAGSS